MSTEIAAKVHVSVLDILNKKKPKQENKNDFWEEHDDYYICKPCALHHKSKDVPSGLKSSIKKFFGVIKKHENLQNHHLTRSKTRHESLALHSWCLSKYEKEKEEQITFEQANEEAGKKVIKNAIYCFQNSLSASNFVALNAKDYTCHLENTATKNDSELAFFHQRDIIFEVLSEKTIRFFQENVTNISVSLDKVTVQRTTYTVVMTYFFCDGAIHVILNKLQKLSLVSNGHLS